MEGLASTTTLAYWVHSKDKMKMKCCEYGYWSSPQNLTGTTTLAQDTIKKSFMTFTKFRTVVTKEASHGPI